MLHRILLVTLLVAVVHGDEDVGDCVLPVPRFGFFMPLVFKPTGDLVQTNHVENITLLSNDRVVLSCYPGYFKKMPTEQVLRATCQSRETLSKFTSRLQYIERQKMINFVSQICSR